MLSALKNIILVCIGGTCTYLHAEGTELPSVNTLCKNFKETPEVILQNRIDGVSRNKQKQALFSILSNQNTTQLSTKFWVDFSGDVVKLMLKDAYRYKIYPTKEFNKNLQSIVKFSDIQQKNCQQIASVHLKKHARKIRELEAKIERLENEENNKSGQFYAIDSRKDGFSGYTHIVQCKTGSLGTVIQRKDGVIHSYRNKNGGSYLNKDYDMTLNEAARLSCK